MRKLKLFFACLLMAVLSIGQVWADPVTSQVPADGESFVIAAYDNSKYYALPNQTSNGSTIAGVEISLNSENKVNTSIAEGKTWTLTEGETAGQYYLSYTSGSDTYYLYKNGTGKTNYNFKVSTGSQNYWSFASNGTGYTVAAIDRGTNNVNVNCDNGTFSCRATATPIILLPIGDAESGDEPGGDEPGGDEPDPTVTFNYVDYKGEGATSPGSDYTMVKTQVSIGSTTFYGNNSQAHFYANGTITITPAAGITISKVVFNTTSTSYNGYQSSGVVTASKGSLSHEGAVVTWTGSQDEAFTITHDKQIRWTTIVVTYEQGDVPSVAKPTISGETPFLTSTTVSITHADADHIYYTTNGVDPTTSSTVYLAPFTVDADGTTIVKAIAVKGSDVSAVASKEFAKGTVLTVAQALEAIDALADNGTIENQFVSGVISQIDSYNSTYHSITYWISADGSTTTDQLKIYGGLAGVVKSAFASVDDVAVGDDVTIKGTLKKYKSGTVITPEFDKDNTIEAYKPIARLAWSAESFDAALEGENTFPSLTNTNGVTVSYSSSDPTKASFADASVYEITLNAAGSTTITATFAGNETYKANSASYTLNVASSLVTLTYNVDGGVAIDPANVSALPNPLPTTTKAGYNFGGWFTDPEKTADAVAGAAITENTTLYAKWLDPYTVAQAKVVIDANPTGTENQYVAGIISQIDSYNNTYHSITYWISADGTTTNQLQVYSGLIGNAATPLGKEAFSAKEDLELGDEVVVTGTLKLHNSSVYEFDKNNTIYTFSRKASAGLEYAVTAIQKTVGDDLFTNPLTNPNSVTVTYSSSDEDVAVVGENTGEVLVGEEGTATITASFAGNEQYKAAEVSYTVTVSAAAPVLTDYYEKVTETAGITDGTYLIVYEGDNNHTPVAFNGALETLEAVGNNIPVTITNDKKIAVTESTEASTFFIDVTAGSIQSASGKYIGANSYGNRLDQSEEASTYVNALSIDDDGNAVISISNTSWDGALTLRYNYGTNNGERFRYYKNGQQPIALYKLANETVKANPELAWSGDVEITLGDDFTAPTLDNPHSVEGITYASDNGTLATVTDAGVIELVADATGTAHITASFAGNDDYKAASVSCTIIVNASAPTPLPTAEAKVVVVEYNSKFYAMSTTVKNSNGFEPIEVTKEDDKIIVKSNEEAAAIQWQIALGTEAATFQNGESKYLACSTESNTGLALLDDASEWAWDADAKCYKQQGKDSKGRTFYYNYNNGSPIFRAYLLTTIGGEGYSGAPEFIDADKIEVQVPTPKIDPELAFDPSEVELTLGEDFTAPTLNHVDGFNGTITYSSSKPAVATVDENTGVVTIVANGTTTITASFAGNDDYEEDEATYTITVNKPAPTPTSTIYRKVTATADITDGEYLIVYEGDATHDAAVFDGSLDNDNIDVAKKVLAVEIENDEIAGNTELDAAVFTIDVTAGSLQSASGLYIGRTANSNGMDKSTTEAYVNTFAIAEGEAVITGVGGCTLRYNYASDQLRFRYYKSGQQAIQLYKKESAEPTYVELREGATSGKYYTVTLEKKVVAFKGGIFWNMSERDADKAYLVEASVEELLAGKPFIFEVTGEKLEVAYEGAATEEAGAKGALRGTFAAMDQAALNAAKASNENSDIFLLYNNTLWNVTKDGAHDNSLAAGRAYIVYDALQLVSETPQGAPGKRVRGVPMHKDTTTGIDALNATETPMKVMIDGTMYILRGEKVYDATGRLVK